MFRQKLEQVRERIGKAAVRCGRNPDEILLLAVTKKFPAAAMLEAYGEGIRQFGENYVREFEEKAPQLGRLEGARFHLIGHLQSNKARKAVELFQVIQTVDTAKLARRLEESLGERTRKLEVMVEVKLSEEQTKAGAAPDEIDPLLEAIRECPGLTLAGLMTMPPWSDDAERSRPYFAQLRRLAARHRIAQLSMGMSHDLEVAIEEGSTCVRVGTALFGPRRTA